MLMSFDGLCSFVPLKNRLGEGVLIAIVLDLRCGEGHKYHSCEVACILKFRGTSPGGWLHGSR